MAPTAGTDGAMMRARRLRPMPLQITVASFEGLDQAWRMLLAQDVTDAAELHVAGHGLVWRAQRDADGRWVTA